MFSTTSAHALRALAHLAQFPEGTYVLGRELAAAAHIPANYLSKILLALRNCGLIATVRGSGGGYRLTKPPRDIRLLEVVELFDKNPVVSPCVLDGERSCSDNHPCTAHDRWCAVRDAYERFLESTNLEDISRREEGRAIRPHQMPATPTVKHSGGARL
ncbi:MAG: Rrf2 family transcriptional regulator [Deltaproteobacteria bacterium]|nr:Rrf2 family transcriptional regulator [Deltaproteobacteria bacterium]